nr:outer membrane lipoprotein chaperone LolA [Photobacterium salinisoli]
MMKNQQITKTIQGVILAAAFLPALAFASAQQELSQRLNKVDAFSATFTQKVTSPEGDLLVEGEGNVSVQRPNLFRWHADTPDENLLVSDGRTLWYYTPMVEQVTAMKLDDATAQTPFVLLIRNQNQDWAKYNVAQTADTFTLTPKDSAAVTGKFVVTVGRDGQVRGFSVEEQDGQLSQFRFAQFARGKQDRKQYSFTPPPGVELDDKR